MEWTGKEKICDLKLDKAGEERKGGEKRREKRRGNNEGKRKRRG